jgi:hypothetical protein
MNGTEVAIGRDRDLTSEASKVYYKHLKEDIVTGFNGGEKFEVFIMVAFLPVGINCFILLGIYVSASGDHCTFKKEVHPLRPLEVKP